jgi:hypothetical protein
MCFWDSGVAYGVRVPDGIDRITAGWSVAVTSRTGLGLVRGPLVH